MSTPAKRAADGQVVPRRDTCTLPPFSPLWLQKYIVVDERGCWLYQAADHGPLGYSCLMVGGVRRKAHQWFYMGYKGTIPKGMSVLHKCDVPKCVNPDHLELGSTTLNNQQRHERGRSRGPIGTANASAKLNDDKVHELLDMYARERPNWVELGRRFGVSYATARDIVMGKIWRHVPRSA